MANSQDLMKKRFHEVQVIKETILEKVSAYQQQFDELSVQANALETQKAQIHEAHLAPVKAQVYELDNELGMIAKALRKDEFKSTLGSREEFLTPQEIEEIRNQNR